MTCPDCKKKMTAFSFPRLAREMYGRGVKTKHLSKTEYWICSCGTMLQKNSLRLIKGGKDGKNKDNR